MVYGQGLSINFGFVVQKSLSDSTRVSCLKDFNDEMCYCLIVDHATGILHGECSQSKVPPIE